LKLLLPIIAALVTPFSCIRSPVATPAEYEISEPSSPCWIRFGNVSNSPPQLQYQMISGYCSVSWASESAISPAPTAIMSTSWRARPSSEV
jgi:hypothetical protein